MLDSDFVNNTATSGGGLYVMGCSVGVSLVTNNFVGNDVSHSGGGLFVAKCSGTLVTLLHNQRVELSCPTMTCF